jgi:hypothetical protein
MWWVRQTPLLPVFWLAGGHQRLDGGASGGKGSGRGLANLLATSRLAHTAFVFLRHVAVVYGVVEADVYRCPEPVVGGGVGCPSVGDAVGCRAHDTDVATCRVRGKDVAGAWWLRGASHSSGTYTNDHVCTYAAAVFSHRRKVTRHI